MDSGSSTVLAAGGEDRLSRLGDSALGHILSFLPATEAARTATLSRRWRHVFAAVHTLSFEESERPLAMGYRWWRRCSYCDNGDMRAPRFVACVSAALHGRHRGARAATAPLRALRVAFDEFGFLGGVDATKALDGWLSYAVYGAGEALQVDLRLGTEPICESAYALSSLGPDVAQMVDDDEEMEEEDEMGNDEMVDEEEMDDDKMVDDDEMAAAVDDDGPCPGKSEYVVPRSLFSSCAVLRALRLGRCWINLPASAIALPCLDTLHLTRVSSRRRGAIQRLVSACPMLADLTLEACGGLTEISVPGPRLRRLALRCCHELAAVNVVGSTTELRAFEYRGAVPNFSSPFLTMHAPRKVSFCSLDFCGVEQAASPELRSLMEPFIGVERLYLTSARLGSSFRSHGGFSFPRFRMLRNLEITGMLPDADEDGTAAIRTVTRILQRTPRLETLSLFFLPEPHPAADRSHYIDRNELNASHKLRYNPDRRLAVPDDVEIACLRERTKEINFVHYQGSVAQRKLAKFLLCNAPVVDVVCWKVARGPLSIQTKLMEEIRGWVMNKSANMTFF